MWAIAPPTKAIIWFGLACASEKAVSVSIALSCSAQKSPARVQDEFGDQKEQIQDRYRKNNFGCQHFRHLFS